MIIQKYYEFELDLDVLNIPVWDVKWWYIQGTIWLKKKLYTLLALRKNVQMIFTTLMPIVVPDYLFRTHTTYIQL